jgi:TonB family protein
MHFKVVGGEPPALNSAEDFISMIVGVDNTRDKKTIGELHYRIYALQEKLPKQAMADANEVFTVVEDQPTPEGGMEAFYDYIQQNLKYPAQARRMGIEGRVFIQFVVDKDGSITDVKSVKGIGAGCDAEAVRIMQNAAAWNPGYQRGRAVRVRMVLPITFRLGDEEVSTESVSVMPEKMKVQSIVKNDRVGGKVVDENNEGVAGVNILIKGTTMGTVTDINGNYQLALPTDAETLIFSFVGYASEELNINGKSVLNVSLSK